MTAARAAVTSRLVRMRASTRARSSPASLPACHGSSTGVSSAVMRVVTAWRSHRRSLRRRLRWRYSARDSSSSIAASATTGGVAAGNLPAGVDGVGGFVDEQAVAGGDDAFVAGAARVGDVRAGSDVDGVDVDPGEVWVVAGGCGCGGAGCNQHGEVGAAGQGWNVAGPGAAPHRPAGIDRAGRVVVVVAGWRCWVGSGIGGSQGWLALWAEA